MASRLPDPDTFLNDLDVSIFLQLKDILSINGTWIKLLNVLEGYYSAADFYAFEQTSFRPIGEPASALLRDMGNKGITVRKLIPYLEELKLERALILIKDYEPVRITADLPSHILAEAGPSPFKLECNATGFPSPSFKWFKYSESASDWTELIEQNSHTLILQPLRFIDAGIYCCRVANQNPHCKEQVSFDYANHATIEVKSMIDRGNHGSPQFHATAPIITLQPSLPCNRGSILMGATLNFECSADSVAPMSYEWFRNGQKIEGETSSSLHLRNIQPENDETKFTIQCKVINCYGETLSRVVTVSLAAPSEFAQYKAEDKIALLIGNAHYSNHRELPSAKLDIISLGTMLKQMDFKVLTLANLNEYEMHNAVDEFCKLLDNDVYGLFYYAGHGFQWRGQCYMVPVTAQEQCNHHECLCLEDVEDRMQEKNPALCCLILDMCRNDVVRSSQRDNYDEFRPRVNRNTIRAYATTFCCSALDGLSNQSNGLFMKHLSKFISSRRPLKEVLDMVVQDISVDPLASRRQYPEILSNLSRRLSLTDKISPMNASRYQEREDYYNFLINFSNPNELCLKFNEININIKIEPQMQVLHNVLDVKLLLNYAGLDEKYVGYIQSITSSENENVEYIQDYVFNDTPEPYAQVLILHTQKIRGSLTMDVRVFCKESLSTSTPHHVELGSPPMAHACLWRRPTYLEATKDDKKDSEDESGFVSDAVH